MATPDLAVLLTGVTQLVARQSAVIGANSDFVAGTTTDPNSFNSTGGTTGDLGYYPMTLVDGTTGYVPCLERLNAIISAAQDAGAAIQPLLGARDAAVAAATAAAASQTAAAASVTAAAASRDAAAASKTAAQGSATAAAASATTAAQAAPSAAAAAASRDAAAGSATTASGYASTATQAASDAASARDATQSMLSQTSAPLTTGVMNGVRWFFNHR